MLVEGGGGGGGGGGRYVGREGTSHLYLTKLIRLLATKLKRDIHTPRVCISHFSE